MQVKNGPDKWPAGSARRLDRRAKPGPFLRFTVSRSGNDSLRTDDGMGRRGLSRAEMGTIVHLAGKPNTCIDNVDTSPHICAMTKSRIEPFDSSHSATTAVAARATASDAKGSINLRIESSTRRLIDDAAAILGKTRTEFMIESARLQAVDVLLDQRLFSLDSARYDAFMSALDNPPAPGPKLRALLRRTPAWQK